MTVRKAYIENMGKGEEQWNRLVRKGGNTKAGSRLGFLERILAFVSFYSGHGVIVGGWLVFKVGSKWQVWSGIIKVPNDMENVDSFSYFNARAGWGSRLLMRFLIGTLANILLGLLLALIVRAILSDSPVASGLPYLI